MKLGDAVAAQESFSARASESVRFLSITGIGIVWLLSGQAVKGLTRGLLWTALALVIVLSFDFAQYLVGSVIWDRFVQAREREGVTREDRVTASDTIHRPIYVLYWAKIGALAVAYGLLACCIVVRM